MTEVYITTEQFDYDFPEYLRTMPNEQAAKDYLVAVWRSYRGGNSKGKPPTLRAYSVSSESEAPPSLQFKVTTEKATGKIQIEEYGYRNK